MEIRLRREDTQEDQLSFCLAAGSGSPSHAHVGSLAGAHRMQDHPGAVTAWWRCSPARAFTGGGVRAWW
jgi:hypothetical protein